MRALYLFLALFLLLSPAQAQGDTLRTRAVETAKRIDLFYQKLGPEAGSILYDPCYVITLAELRAHARWNGFKGKDPEVRQALMDLNTISKPMGFEFEVTQSGGLIIRSLRGLIESSQHSDFPWLQPFPEDGTFEDWQGWVWKHNKLARVYSSSQGWKNESLGFHFVEGFMLGYPELAVRRYMTNSHDPYHHKRAINVGIDYRQHLSNGEPSYDILPEDCDHPKISAHADHWSGFLRTFYELETVRQRLHSDTFLAGRIKVAPKLDHSDTEKWWRGENLAGAWDTKNYKINRNHELVLHRHIEDLEKLIGLGTPPPVWVRACQKWAFESEDTSKAQFSGRIVGDWFWWGAWSKDGPRGRFYLAVSKAQPKLFAALAQKRLKWIRQDIERGRERKSWNLRRAALLYRHPQFQTIFPQLSEEEKTFVLTDIRVRRKDRAFRELVGEIARNRTTVFESALLSD